MDDVSEDITDGRDNFSSLLSITPSNKPSDLHSLEAILMLIRTIEGSSYPRPVKE